MLKKILVYVGLMISLSGFVSAVPLTPERQALVDELWASHSVISDRASALAGLGTLSGRSFGGIDLRMLAMKTCLIEARRSSDPVVGFGRIVSALTLPEMMKNVYPSMPMVNFVYSIFGLCRTSSGTVLPMQGSFEPEPTKICRKRIKMLIRSLGINLALIPKFEKDYAYIYKALQVDCNDKSLWAARSIPCMVFYNLFMKIVYFSVFFEQREIFNQLCELVFDVFDSKGFTPEEARDLILVYKDNSSWAACGASVARMFS